MCKINNEYLSYAQNLTLVNGAEEVSVNFKIAHPSDCTNYVINHTPDLLERVTVYKNGLVIYIKQTSKQILTKSNYPFVDRDGSLWIMNE
ncbi:hypothetical protein [Limosilactobacillus pontis]|uniref:hypothetical protein n=1 Tax=Limosilactobacillus pontis TaxID=35787 RepID=UPI002F260D58